MEQGDPDKTPNGASGVGGNPRRTDYHLLGRPKRSHFGVQGKTGSPDVFLELESISCPLRSILLCGLVTIF